MEQVKTVYRDFAARIDPASWERLVSAEVCLALDTRPAAEDALLKFFMEDYYIPQKVWRVLDDTFHWTERREELYENYPRDFVDYAVLDGIRLPDSLPYELFSPGDDAESCDTYRRLYYGAKANELPYLVEKLKALPESHPYGELLEYRLLLETAPEEALAGYERLADTYPEDTRMQLEWATQCMTAGNYAVAEEYARRALEVSPQMIPALNVLSDSLAGQEKYAEAREVLMNLSEIAGMDQMIQATTQKKLVEWNEKLIAQQEALLQEDPGNNKVRSELAKCLIQNGREAEALALCEQFTPDYEDRYDYHNVYGRALVELKRLEEAIPHIEETIALLRVMEPDGTEETDKRIGTLPNKLQMLGQSLLMVGRTDEGYQVLEEALNLAPKNPLILSNMGCLLAQQGDMERAAEIFERLTQVMPTSHVGYRMLAQAMYDLRRDRDAFDAVNRALQLEGGDLGVYLLKMQILLRNGVWDEVRSTLNFLRENGVNGEINTDFCEAMLMEQGENKEKEALERYHAIAKRLEAGEQMETPAKVYFRILCIEGKKLNGNKPEDREKMLALAEKGLGYDPEDPDCLDYKAWLLRKDGKILEAAELYHRLERRPQTAANARLELARTYYEDLDRYADKSLHYFTLLLKENEDPDYHFYAGFCCRYLGRFAEGEAHFLRMQALAPEDVDGYRGLAGLYECMGRYCEALEQINKAIAMKGDNSSYYDQKARILRRLCRPYEAAEVILESAERCGNENWYSDLFETYCQFGLWKDAEELLKKWRKSGKGKHSRIAAEVELDLLLGNVKKAGRHLLWNLDKITEKDAERLSLMEAEISGKERTQLKILNRRIRKQQESDGTHTLSNMAQVLWWSGKYDLAREYAAKALTQLEEIIPYNKNSEALYRSRRCVILAILGRVEEAREELAAVRALPLCAGCCYGSCKDADIYEANIEEILGNWQKAWELYSAGAQKWPDDTDFIAGMCRTERKGAGEQ